VIGRLPGEHSYLSLVWAVLDRASVGWRGVCHDSCRAAAAAGPRRALHEPPTQLPQCSSEIHTETAMAPTDSAAIA
jgi:hypothetical protein